MTAHQRPKTAVSPWHQFVLPPTAAPRGRTIAPRLLTQVCVPDSRNRHIHSDCPCPEIQPSVYPVESNMLAMQPLRHDMHIRYTLV